MTATTKILVLTLVTSPSLSALAMSEEEYRNTEAYIRDRDSRLLQDKVDAYLRENRYQPREVPTYPRIGCSLEDRRGFLRQMEQSQKEIDYLRNELNILRNNPNGK